MKAVMLTASLSLLLASCASTPTVHTDFDSAARFDRYKTYSWAIKPEAASPLTQQRILAGVDRRLRDKGLSPVASGGDLVVAVHVASAQKTTLDTMYTGTGLGGWGWRGGMGMASATTHVHTYNVGTLIVDLFDGASQQAVWRGTASGTVSSSPDKNAVGLEDGLDKMFAGYPPSTAAR